MFECDRAAYQLSGFSYRSLQIVFVRAQSMARVLSGGAGEAMEFHVPRSELDLSENFENLSSFKEVAKMSPRGRQLHRQNQLLVTKFPWRQRFWTAAQSDPNLVSCFSPGESCLHRFCLWDLLIESNTQQSSVVVIVPLTVEIQMPVNADDLQLQRLSRSITKSRDKLRKDVSSLDDPEKLIRSWPHCTSIAGDDFLSVGVYF